MHEETFTSEFVREYLRYIQRKRSTITGLFFSQDKAFIWGAIGDYGEPPRGGLLVEMWPEDEPDNSYEYRFWHANPDGQKYRRTKPVMRDELTKVDS